MGTYTVKSGDTLSGIGASQGVDWKSITGYKSGNPNLIYPGETLSWGQPTTTPTVAPAPTQTPAPIAAPISTPTSNVPMTGSSEALTGELTNLDNASQNPIDIYNAALEKAGIVDARTRVTSLRKSLMDNQNLLDNLSGNISGRTANSLVTEAQRQRLLATESTPIVDAGNKLNQGLSLAQGDYNTITGEAKNTTDLTVAGNQAKRTALLDRLKLAIDNETNAETKRKWQAEYDRQTKLDAEATAQDTRNFNYKVSQDAITNSQNQQKITNSGSDTSNSNYNTSESKSGGTTYYKDGAPVKPSTWYIEQGKNLIDLKNDFLKSKDKGDINIANDISNGMSIAELKSKYPWVF